VHCAHSLKRRFAAAIATSKGINVIPIFRRVVSGPNETFVERLVKCLDRNSNGGFRIFA
jgi:hypothetical protein